MDDPAARSSLLLSPLPSVAGHGNLSRRARASRCHGSLPLMILDIQRGINHCLCLSSAFFSFSPFSFLPFFATSYAMPFRLPRLSLFRFACSSLRFILVIIIVNVVDRFLVFLKRSTLPFRGCSATFGGTKNIPSDNPTLSLFSRNIKNRGILRDLASARNPINPR